jgi:hypothetical protein
MISFHHMQMFFFKDLTLPCFLQRYTTLIYHLQMFFSFTTYFHTSSKRHNGLIYHSKCLYFNHSIHTSSKNIYIVLHNHPTSGVAQRAMLYNNSAMEHNVPTLLHDDDRLQLQLNHDDHMYLT